MNNKTHMKEILFSGLYTPQYHTAGSSGFDIQSSIDCTLEAGEFKKIPTGLYLSIPCGYEVQIRPRSGLAVLGITVLNSPGTIDSDYTDEIHILLINHSKVTYNISCGHRIAQGVLSKVEKASFIYASDVQSMSNRGGFGSTGK